MMAGRFSITQTFCALCLIPLILSMQIKNSFRDPKDNFIQDIAVHKNSGEIIVGATNSLWKLSPDLVLTQSVDVGPRLDNPYCPPPQIPCDKKKTWTNSFSQGLALSSDLDSLIACSSLFHGFCQIRSLKNITLLLKDVSKPIVSNNPSIPSYMFVGKGVNSSQVLYIGTKYSDFGVKGYRNLVPHISSRNLNTLDFTYRDSKGGTKISVLEGFRTDVLVEFVYSFTYGDYVYFVTSQRNPKNPDMLESRLIRICQDDKYFRSYVEIPVACMSTNNMVFNVAKGAHTDESLGKLYINFEHTQMNQVGPSALCAFGMDDIKRTFDLVVTECYQGDGSRGPAHIHQSESCTKSNLSPDFCGQTEESSNYYPIEGRNTIHQMALIEFPSTVLTAIKVSQSGQNAVTFLGTADGELKKVVISPSKEVTVVKEIMVDPGETIKSLQFSPDQMYLYALTMNKIVKVDIEHCKEKLSCEKCTSDSDPICGWCVMENRCTEIDRCPRSALYPHWLPSKKGACAKMVEIQPQYVSYESIESDQHGQQISFKLEEIMLSPQNTDIELHCSFTDTSKTIATVKNEVVTCPLPGQQDLPMIPKGKDHHELEVEFHVGGHAIVKRSVSVYDCRGHISCTDCTQSNFSCEWLYDSNSCVSTTANTASRQIAGISNPDQCPRIESQSGSTDIVVHSGETKQIAVKVSSLQAGQSDNVKCQFTYLGNSTIVNGTMITSSRMVQCESVKFEFKDERAYVVADFKVTWGQQSFPLDNPRQISVRIYKCPLMVTNCGQCLSMDSEYECGWCENKCTLQKHCTQKQWQDRNDVCANPTILRFSPSTGPINGKTNISVTGINLGKTYNDIKNSITVAGINCIVHPEHYEPSLRFLCETELSSEVKSGTIKLEVSNKFNAESDSNFSFVDPHVMSMAPVKGPKSGGTMLSIYGDEMNTGTKVTVDVGGSPCLVMKQNKTMLECKTTAQVTSDDQVDVEVSFGGYTRIVPEKFTYEDDPTISRIEPMKSIISGGVTLSVVGEGLDLIQKPEFFVELRNKKITTDCQHDNVRIDNTIFKSWLHCRTPRIMLIGENISDTNPKELHFGFNLDGVTTWRNISRRDNMGPLLYYPDPVIEQFVGDDGIKPYRKGERLVIKGSFRSVNPLLRDVNIIVGMEECRNIEATDTAVTCEPPVKPTGINDKGNAMVMIQVGNLQQKVGYLQYYVNENKEKPITVGIILGVVLPIIAIIVLLTICVVRRHRKNGPTERGIPDVLKDYEGKKEDEELGMNNVSVKADMNGQIPDNIDSGPYISGLLDRIQDEATRQNISNFLIPSSKLDIVELIGKGLFGNTYEAQYTREDGEKKKESVTVKSLQGCNTDNDTIVTFLNHCAILKDLQHPNILPILGICLTAGEEPLLVRSYLQRGDLKSYVRDPAKNITVLELLEFANQVVEAMQYLENLHIVHRNLAARNCLISDEKEVKVSDYGFTQLFSEEYYSGEENRARQTIKWLAPEAIGTFNFTTKTDVWSYGILLWELLTRGVTPYPDIEPDNLKEYLTSGHRLKKPRQCPDSVYLLMLKCWTENSTDRPTFQEIGVEVKQFIQSDDDSDSVTKPLKANIELGGSTEYVEVAE